MSGWCFVDIVRQGVASAVLGLVFGFAMCIDKMTSECILLLVNNDKEELA